MVLEVPTEKLEEYMTPNLIAIEKHNPTHIVKKTQFGLFNVHRDGFVSEFNPQKHASSIWIIKEY